MKKLLIIILVLSGLKLSYAQIMQNQPMDKSDAVGIKGGVNMPRMLYYDNSVLGNLPQDFVFTPMGGLYVDIPLAGWLHLAPEAVYVQRGSKMSYVHVPSGATVNYSIMTHNVDLRIPLELVWPISPYFQPFLTLGGEAGMCLGGQIHLDRTAPIAYDQTIAVDSANMNLIHAGAYVGVGVRSMVAIGNHDILLKFNATFHQGLLDSYSAYETEGTSQAVNVNAYQIWGKRMPQGLEVSLGIAIPLRAPEEDACATFAKDRKYHRGTRGHLFGY